MRSPSIAVELLDDHVVVAPAGELDLASRDALLDAYERAIEMQAVPRIVVDLSRVTYMDSTGLGAIAAAMNKVKARGGALWVVGASGRIASLFRITELDAVVPVASTATPGPRGVVRHHDGA